MENIELKDKLISINRITKVVKGLSNNPKDNSKIEDEVRTEVISLCSSFQIYKHLK